MVVDLERFSPERWDQIIGNQAIKEYFWDMIYGVRKEGHRSGYNALISGGSRGGKTSGIGFGIKCMLCCNFDLDTMNPCHRCANCTAKFHLYGTGGWHNHVDFCDEELNPTPVHVHFMPLDCTSLTSSDIDACLGEIRVDDGVLRIVYLDEVHRLAPRGLDERFLKPLEDYKAIWIASSAIIKKDDNEDSSKLEKMFQNRFTYRLQTQKPQVRKMIHWMAERCHECSIKVEAPETTLKLLAERSERVPGMALQVLNKAHKSRSKLLTRSLVEDHVFDLDD